MFPSGSFIFKSLMHFDFILVYNVRKWSTNTAKISFCLEGWWSRNKLSPLTLFFLDWHFLLSTSGSASEWEPRRFAVFLQNQYDDISVRAARGRSVCPEKPTQALLWNLVWAWFVH